MFRSVSRFFPLSFFPLLAFIIGSTFSQEIYRIPPQDIASILDAPSLPSMQVSPDGKYLLFVYRHTYPGISDLAVPFMNLAGSRINPRTNGNYSTAGRIHSLGLKPIEGGEESMIRPSGEPHIGSIIWSHRGDKFAFTNTTDRGVELWITDIPSGNSFQIGGLYLNDIGSSTYRWMPDGRSILARIIPGNRPPRPESSGIPAGPILQDADGRPAPARTYRNLLGNPEDELLYEYYFTSQLVLIDVTDGTFMPVGEPAVYRDLVVSPDGRFILVSLIERPYSYLVPASRFPYRTEIWSTAGEFVRHITSVPLGENIPLFGVVTQPRSFVWNPSEDSQLLYVQALDEGDPQKDAAYRDAVYLLDAPFDGQPVELMKLGYRHQRIIWGRDFALINEFDLPTRRVRTWLLSPVSGDGERVLLFDRDSQDRYNDPGIPLLTHDARGSILCILGEDGNTIFLAGEGASPRGDRPFLDAFNLSDRSTVRLWQTGDDRYERVVEMLDNRGASVVTQRETVTEPPNYYLRDFLSGGERRLTDFADPHPQLTGISRRLITYRRDDGIDLSAILFLPPEHRDGDTHPLVVWVYPSDYVSPDAASQVRGNPNQFTFLRGATHLFFLLRGYAILDGPSLPIIGTHGNDTYTEQLVAGMKAALEKVVELGVADTSRMGIGGHSYGAFSTVNLLIHTDYFKAGIARSGAYNRTLTPFGFQAERRTFWEAPDTYMRVSPFALADKIRRPLLIIHGMDDSNSGTFPIQSERLFHAIRGLGGIAQYVQYPYEDHGYRARETVGDAVYRMLDWFDRYVLRTGYTSE